MNKHNGIAPYLVILLVVVVMLWMLISVIISVTDAHAATPNRTFRFTATEQAHTVRIPGAGQNLELQSVAVNGRAIRFGEQSGPSTASMYGRGAAIRFFQRGRVHYARCVTISGSVTMTVTYHLVS